MDLASLIGLIGGFGIVIMAMVLGGGVGMFLDTPSFLIVIVGTIFVALMKFKESKDYIKIYRSGDSSSGDYGIGQFVFSETMHARVIELIT